MKYLASLLFILFCQQVNALPNHELQRINFYPDVQAFLKAEYSYQNLEIKTPEETFDQKSVRNYRNLLNLSYAYNFQSFFLGTTLSYEIASESAANYGISSSERFTSHGFKAPVLFFISRLREQKGTTGNIDLFLAYAPALGGREIGNSTANRLEGRKKFTLRLSHGMLEEEWEFKNSFEYNYFSHGNEHNDFSQNTFHLESYNIFKYSFNGQYEANEWLYIYAGAEFEYRTIQKIYDKDNNKREIQAGTGSIFNLGIKKPLYEWAVIELQAELERYSYFVIGNNNNFDGDASQTTYTLTFTQGF